MKKVCLYIVGIVLVIGISLGVSGQVRLSSILNFLGVIQTEEEAVKTVYTALRDGEENITIRFYGDKKDIEGFAQNIVEEAFQIDDEATSDDFDYMKNKYRGYTASIGGIGVYNINYEFKFSETHAQTQWLNDRVQEILTELKVNDVSEYQKIKKIHDYIINNIAYDITVENNSAYEGLKNHATACQGYANLAYKMLTEVGIECRVITGKADGEAHAWNIVKINDDWYNLDCTWDDPIGGSTDSVGKKYAYFLKSNSNFREHVRDAEYDTSEFNEKYKMSEGNWTKNK